MPGVPQEMAMNALAESLAGEVRTRKARHRFRQIGWNFRGSRVTIAWRCLRRQC